jgi:hypothetical protein
MMYAVEKLRAACSRSTFGRFAGDHDCDGAHLKARVT